MCHVCLPAGTGAACSQAQTGLSEQVKETQGEKGPLSAKQKVVSGNQRPLRWAGHTEPGAVTLKHVFVSSFRE